MIHTAKDFSTADETEIDFFFPLRFPYFLYNPANVGNLISSSSSFYKPSLDIWKFLFSLMLKPSMQDFKHDVSSMGDECNCLMVSTFFCTILLGNWGEDWPFQSCGQSWVFQICWPNECKTFMASSFRDLNGFSGISSHPVLLLTAVLFKVHLTLYSRISVSGWLITPS